MQTQAMEALTVPQVLKMTWEKSQKKEKKLVIFLAKTNERGRDMYKNQIMMQGTIKRIAENLKTCRTHTKSLSLSQEI